MIRDITLGQYYHADSVIHKLDPRTKVVGTFVFIIALFYTDKDLSIKYPKYDEFTAFVLLFTSINFDNNSFFLSEISVIKLSFRILCCWISLCSGNKVE